MTRAPNPPYLDSVVGSASYVGIFMTAAGRRDADADADADATRLLDSSHRTARERTNRGATTCARIARRIARAVAVAVAVAVDARRFGGGARVCVCPTRPTFT
jgi:hypothetical protein